MQQLYESSSIHPSEPIQNSISDTEDTSCGSGHATSNDDATNAQNVAGSVPTVERAKPLQRFYRQQVMDLANTSEQPPARKMEDQTDDDQPLPRTIMTWPAETMGQNRVDSHTNQQLETAYFTSVAQNCQFQKDEVVRLKEQSRALSREMPC